jgi:hypothetical protein
MKADGQNHTPFPCGLNLPLGNYAVSVPLLAPLFSIADNLNLLYQQYAP